MISSLNIDACAATRLLRSDVVLSFRCPGPITECNRRTPPGNAETYPSWTGDREDERQGKDKIHTNIDSEGLQAFTRIYKTIAEGALGG